MIKFSSLPFSLLLDRMIIAHYGINGASGYFVFTSCLLLILAISKFGVEPYVTSLFSKNNMFSSTTTVLSMFMSVIFSIITTCIFVSILAFLNIENELSLVVVENYPYLLISIIFSVISSYIGLYFQYLNKILLFYLSQMFLNNILMCLFISFGALSFIDPFVLYAVSSFLSLILLISILLKSKFYSSFDKLSIRKIRKLFCALSSKYLSSLVGIFFQMLVLRGVVFWAAIYYTNKDITLINVSLKLALLFGMITSVVNTVLIPILSNRVDDYLFYRSYFTKVLCFLVMYSLLGSIVIIYNSDILLSFFSDELHVSTGTVAIFIVSQSFSIISGLFSLIIIIKGDFPFFRRMNMYSFFIFSISLYLMSNLGVSSIPIALCFSAFFNVILSGRYTYRHYKSLRVDYV